MGFPNTLSLLSLRQRHLKMSCLPLYLSRSCQHCLFRLWGPPPPSWGPPTHQSRDCNFSRCRRVFRFTSLCHQTSFGAIELLRCNRKYFIRTVSQCEVISTALGMPKHYSPVSYERRIAEKPLRITILAL